MSTSEKRATTQPVMVRMTPDDRAMLSRKAHDVGMTLPKYLTACGLGRKTRSAMDDHIVNELRRLGELQRELCTKNGGLLTTEYSAVLVEILGAVRRIGV